MAHPVARAWVTLAGLVAALVVLVLPSLLITGPDAAGSVTLGILAVALAALATVGLRCRVDAARTGTAVCPTGAEAAPVLAGRVTDPVHHPLRPRAPGLP